MDLEQFILFNPVTGSPKEIPEGAGNYFVVLKEGHSLPDVGLPVVMAKYRGMDIVYTGVAGASSLYRCRGAIQRVEEADYVGTLWRQCRALYAQAYAWRTYGLQTDS